jgi:amidohydrolase
MDSGVLKQRVVQEIDRLSPELCKISAEIYSHPEIGYEEHFASQLLSGTLERAGFSIQRSVAGLETGFVGKIVGRSAAPEIALLAEFDALPGLGHACGHNLIATAALGAGLALRSLMDSIEGSLMIAGAPAEEKVGGKIAFVENGVFKDTAAAMMVHPRGATQLGRMFLATTNIEMIFQGKSSHAAAAPEKGINALDACIATFNGTNALKKHLRDDARLHGVILDGGTAANIVPERARAVFSVRARDRVYLEQTIAIVSACAIAGALMAGATVETNVLPICAEMNYNRTVSDAFGDNASALGHQVLPIDQFIGGGSTDMGNVSQAVPSIHPFIKIGDTSLTPHTREFLEAAGSTAGQHAMLDAAKILAMTAIDLWTDPDLLRRAHIEFQQSQKYE